MKTNQTTGTNKFKIQQGIKRLNKIFKRSMHHQYVIQGNIKLQKKFSKTSVLVHKILQRMSKINYTNVKERIERDG